ncbi:TetR/AcrR family transcriptional regulator C-terminal domain-containing protein [Streptomyces roseus]|uniref:TetR/AcrR family transcriptional regulator C-terminal domain-containing protein n=1 Tax=Streptomyces roseus TaxID=66430 RepID=UPI001FD79BF7|nr:TetR/AcrR family transcriptional regulator C-terminal domain-containing protein [Streptomyces roseus]
MDLDHHRVGRFLAADRDPLLDAADPDEALLVDAVRAVDAQLPGAAGAPQGAVAEQAGDRCGEEYRGALYRYVLGKAELLDLMVDAAFGPAPDVAAVAGGWRPRLEVWARACWQEYRRRPWMVAATGMRRQLMGPRQLAWLDSAFAAMAGTGLPYAQQHAAFLLLVGHVRGLAQQLVDDDEERRQEWNRLTADVWARHGDRFPALTAAIAGGAFASRPGDPLDFGLERILDGVAALIERS